MNITVTFEKQASGIFTPDFLTSKPDTVIDGAPIADFAAHIHPESDEVCRRIGDKCVAEIKANIIADFEKNAAYCEKHPDSTVDMMVHVSTFTIINGVIYMTYYANTGTDAEDPAYQEARLAFCPVDDTSDMTIVRILGAGDTLDGRKVDRVYDTILLHRDDDLLYIMFTASVDEMYYRFYCTYTIATGVISSIRPNRLKVGEVTNDFSTCGIISALAENEIGRKQMFSDIGIMQKLTTRVEDGVTYYYTGAYSGYLNFIIKSKDFITWEYVAAPDFVNLSLWENAVYVIGDKCYYFVRQDKCGEGFLTAYDLVTGKWDMPCLITDSQSRSDFVMYDGELYLTHSPLDRNGFGIVRIDRDDLSKSTPILVADMKESLFYPYTLIYGDEFYISYTIDRKHIRLSHFDVKHYFK